MTVKAVGSFLLDLGTTIVVSGSLLLSLPALTETLSHSGGGLDLVETVALLGVYALAFRGMFILFGAYVED